MNSEKIFNASDSVIRFFLYVLIFWLPYSPAVIESCVVSGLIIFLFKRAVLFIGQGNLSVSFDDSALIKPLMFFLFVCILSVLGSSFFYQSWHNFLTKTVEWFVVLLLVVESIKSGKHIRVLLVVIWVTAVATALDGLFQYYISHKDIFYGRQIIAPLRATAAFTAPTGLGGYLIFMCPVVLIQLIIGKGFWRKWLIGGVGGGLLIWAITVTFARGAWLGFLFGIIFFVFGWALIPRLKTKLFIILSSVFFILTIIAPIGWIKIHKIEDALINRSTGEWRLRVWKDAMVMVKDKPVFGHGINTFMPVFQSYRRDPYNHPTYAHNSYLQLLTETGVFGLSAFLWLLGVFLKNSVSVVCSYYHRVKDDCLLALAGISGMLAFLIQSFFDTNFYSLQLSVLLWFMVGVIWVQINIIKRTAV